MKQLINDKFNTKGEMEPSNQMMDVKMDYLQNKIANDCIKEDIMLGESDAKAFQKELFDLRIEMNTKSEIPVVNTSIDNHPLSSKNTLLYVFFLGLMIGFLTLSALIKDVIFSSLLVSFSIIIGCVTFHKLRNKKFNNH